MRLSARRSLIGALAVLSFMGASVSAQAAPNPFLKVAATNAAPVGQPVQLFDGACGLAVDPSARLFVSDYRHGVVARFGTGLTPPPPSIPSLATAIETNYASTASQNSPCAVAADSAGSLFAADYHQGVIRYLGPELAEPLAPANATGLAVDQATDALYVSYRNRVDAFAAPITSATIPTQIGVGGALGDAYGLAVSGFPGTQGYLYVADAADDAVKVFDPATDPDEPVAIIDGSGTPPGSFRDLTDASLAIDDDTGTLYVLDNLQPGFEHPAAAVYAFGPGGTYLGRLPKEIVHAEPSGLAVDNSTADTRGLIYVTSGNEVLFNPVTQEYEGSKVLAFCPTEPASLALDLACPAPTPARPILIFRSGSGSGTVTASGAQISCGTLCATEADQGTLVTLTATPKPHSAFAGWSVDGGTSACGTAPTCKVTISSAVEATATFTAIPQRQLTVATSGAGAVTSSPVGLNCGAICSASFDEGTKVTLHPEPGPGSQFAGWSGACSGAGACVVTLAGARAVTASFTPIARVTPVPPGEALRTLSISVSGEGAGRIASEPAGIDCGTPCSNAYAPGTAVTLTATPDRESKFLGWSGCDVAAGARCTVTLAASRTVGASFAEAPPRKQCTKKKGKKGKQSKCKPTKKPKTTKKGKGKK